MMLMMFIMMMRYDRGAERRPESKAQATGRTGAYLGPPSAESGSADAGTPIGSVDGPV